MYSTDWCPTNWFMLASFWRQIVLPCICKLNFLHPFTCWWDWGGLCILATMNSAAGTCECRWLFNALILFLVEMYLVVRLLGFRFLLFSFLRLSLPFSIMAMLAYIPTHRAQGSLYSLISPRLVFLCLSIRSVLTGISYSIAVWIFISLMIRDIDHFLILAGHGVLSFEKHLFSSFLQVEEEVLAIRLRL